MSGKLVHGGVNVTPADCSASAGHVPGEREPAEDGIEAPPRLIGALVD